MRFLATIQPLPVLDSIARLLTAFILGTLIGIERPYRRRSAGLRTNMLVAVGAAAFVDIASAWPAMPRRCASSPMSCRASASSAQASS